MYTHLFLELLEMLLPEITKSFTTSFSCLVNNEMDVVAAMTAPFLTDPDRSGRH